MPGNSTYSVHDCIAEHLCCCFFSQWLPWLRPMSITHKWRKLKISGLSNCTVNRWDMMMPKYGNKKINRSLFHVQSSKCTVRSVVQYFLLKWSNSVWAVCQFLALMFLWDHTQLILVEADIISLCFVLHLSYPLALKWERKHFWNLSFPLAHYIPLIFNRGWSLI